MKAITWKNLSAAAMHCFDPSQEREKARRAIRQRIFHGRFYGAPIFCCKTAQFCEMRCKTEMAETPSVRNAAQRGENARKNSFLN
jgi:hypothetical protein